MSHSLPRLYLARHGETEWALAGKHTGRTDIPLTKNGEDDARKLGQRLRALELAAVFSSPLMRAKRTCEIAELPFSTQFNDALMEWNYGEYEGLRTVEIQERHPAWNVFLDGCPGGESAEQVGARVDTVLDSVRAQQGNVLIFAHAHLLRVLVARWVRLVPSAGSLFVLGTSSFSELGYDHSLDEPVVRIWNDRSHL